jgi:hypothetical protein
MLNDEIKKKKKQSLRKGEKTCKLDKSPKLGLISQTRYP